MKLGTYHDEHYVLCYSSKDLSPTTVQGYESSYWLHVEPYWACLLYTSLLGIEIDPHSIEFYDSAFALFNWENKQDTAEALKAAQADAEGKVDQTGMIEQANEQARTLVENLLHPFTVGEGAYTLQIVDA